MSFDDENEKHEVSAIDAVSPPTASEQVEVRTVDVANWRTPSHVGETQVTREQLLDELTSDGSWLTVVVNGRPLVLGSAIKLIEALPETARLRRRDRKIFVDPNPFNRETQQSDQRPTTDAVVTRLLSRQTETDRLAEREQSWWRKIVRGLTHTS